MAIKIISENKSIKTVSGGEIWCFTDSKTHILWSLDFKHLTGQNDKMLSFYSTYQLGSFWIGRIEKRINKQFKQNLVYSIALAVDDIFGWPMGL